MALVTSLEVTLGPNMARFYVTYDDTNQRIQSVRIENDYDFAVRIVATNPTQNPVTQTVAARVYFTYTLANNERYFYDQWSYSMSQA